MENAPYVAVRVTAESPNSSAIRIATWQGDPWDDYSQYAPVDVHCLAVTIPGETVWATLLEESGLS